MSDLSINWHQSVVIIRGRIQDQSTIIESSLAVTIGGVNDIGEKIEKTKQKKLCQ
jgi:hypothetical protein